MHRCDGCGRGVAATSKDPIHWPGTRKLCTTCLHVPEKNAEKAASAPTTRADAARARWAAKTDEEKRAHVAKMQAGRGLRAT